MSKDKNKLQRFTKDGDDDDRMPRRPPRRSGPSKPKPVYSKCACGGNLKPKGASGSVGRTSSKCNKCGRRVWVQHYKGRAGLVNCY